MIFIFFFIVTSTNHNVFFYFIYHHKSTMCSTLVLFSKIIIIIFEHMTVFTLLTQFSLCLFVIVFFFKFFDFYHVIQILSLASGKKLLHFLMFISFIMLNSAKCFLNQTNENDLNVPKKKKMRNELDSRKLELNFQSGRWIFLWSIIIRIALAHMAIINNRMILLRFV